MLDIFRTPRPFLSVKNTIYWKQIIRSRMEFLSEINVWNKGENVFLKAGTQLIERKLMYNSINYIFKTTFRAHTA